MLEYLILASLQLAPKSLDEGTAREHVVAAQAASDQTGVPVDLLLGMAYVESRYNPLSLSRIECKRKVCRRVTGIWTKSEHPPGARPSWFCGVMQVGGYVPWERCLELRDLKANYLEGAQHLSKWKRTSPCSRRRGDENLVCALQGYGGGWRAIEVNATRYAYHVIGVQHHILRLLHKFQNV